MVENPILPPEWREILQKETSATYFSDLIDHVRAAYAAAPVYPPAEQIFRAFELCPFGETRVVIIGQDPYHAAGQAHGLCFSVNPGVKIPPSLRNIYKELQQDIPGFVPPVSGDLGSWARQGVLLLNAVLTVRGGEPGSHRSLGWEKFTDAVIRVISDQRPAVVFMLWGNYAIAKENLIDRQKHLVLRAPHPSPLARGGFSGCRHFSAANNWLSAKNLRPINWFL